MSFIGDSIALTYTLTSKGQKGQKFLKPKNQTTNKVKHTKIQILSHTLLYLAFLILKGVNFEFALRCVLHPQTEDVVEEGVPCVPPALDVLHQLVGREKVTGAVYNGTIGDVSGQITARLATGELTTELPGVDGSGAEGAVTAFLHSLLQLSLDGSFQVMCFRNLKSKRK